MGYEVESDCRESMSRRGRARRVAIACAMMLVLAAFAWWRGYLPCWGSVGSSDAWRNVSGTDECFPFRVRDGKGFVYQGKNYDDPCDPVVTRPDWTIAQGGRTYVLFEIDPGNMEPSGFHGVFQESLWIGLLGEDGEVVRKIRLATGVKDISGIRRALRTGAYVSATRADGVETVIPLRFPKPWPALKPTGDAWKDFERRQNRLVDKLWEDWPGNASGYAADWVSARIEEEMEKECRSAIDALKAVAPTDARRDELESEFNMARRYAWASAGDSSATAFNVHWGNFTDRMTRERVMESYLRNWLEARENPPVWEIVRGATGTLHGVEFAATSGVAIISVPGAWVARRWNGEPEPETPPAERVEAADLNSSGKSESPDQPANSDNDDDEAETDWRTEAWQLLLRLSPKKVHRESGAVFADYELVAPDVQDSGYMVEKGRIIIGHGD